MRPSVRLLLPLLLAAAPLARAADPAPITLTQQGRLLGPNDQPVNGPTELTFELHETDNPAVVDVKWSETRTVQVSDGLYATTLGDTRPGRSGTALPQALLVRPELYLSVRIGGAELLPRMRLGTAAYALRAQRAAEAEKVLADGVDTSALQNAAVTTGKLADGAVTLAKLQLTNGKFVGLDADTLDGLDASAFAPASIEVTLGTPPTGSSLAQEIAAIKTSALAGATAAALAALDTRLDTEAAALKADTAALRADTATLKADTAALQTAIGSITGATVAARVDATNTTVGSINTAVGTANNGITALKTAVGTPTGASLAADIADLKATLVGYINDRKWKKIGPVYANFDALLAQYPLTDWEWGLAYNSGTLVPVNINGWNGGWRISSVYGYAQGDTPSQLVMGGFTLLKGLSSNEDDTCNNGGQFLHYYTKPYQAGVIPNSGNGCVNPDFYVRRW